jgi:DNA polymerase I-like protein with 3'-5' exonuclease and polymerase domains
VQLVEQATADDILVLDIENPEQKDGSCPIVCVGFALDEKLSITIPTTKSYWGDALDDVWATIRYILSLPVHKGAWNNFHEQYWLYDEHGITIENLWWDGMYMHHALDPSAPHSLAFCASVDTREPYWKDEAKDPKDARKYTSNMAAFYAYNGKDCCVTWELINVYYQRLLHERRVTSAGEIDGIEFYLKHYAEIYRPLLDLTRAGLRVDSVRRQERFDELTARVARAKEQLQSIGADIYATGKGSKGAISRPKLATYLYRTLGLPTQYKRNKKKGEKTATTDEVAIRTLWRKYPDKLSAFAPVFLDQVRCKKLSEFYDQRRVDADGYFRSSYSPNTEAGRLNSKENPKGGGSNAQNIDREARDMFTSDPGCIGIEVDLSQIEARIVYAAIYALTGDRDLLDKARCRPDDYDQHSEMAAKIFGKTSEQWDALPKDERSLLRYLGKTTVHAAQRDQGPKGLSDRLAKDGYYYGLAECKRFIDGYRRALPGLEEWFREVRRRVMADKRLMTDWGRILRFDYDRLDDNTYRAAYSFDPQANCADHMNQKGLIPFHWWLRDEKAGRINAHIHDALFFSVVPERAYGATKFLVESLESPYTYHGVELSIPCEIKIGLTMKGSHAWKRLPSQTDFEEVIWEIMR